MTNNPSVSGKMFPRGVVVYIIGLLFIVHKSSTLSITNMTAPVIQDPRKNLHIFCKFDMGGEDLYAVKWYKDDHEFYRYSPSGPSKYVQYPVPGVKVEVRSSKCVKNSCVLVLTELRRPESSGAYRCEVSSEAPAFRLASQTYNITVAALPEIPPAMENLSDNYFFGEIILATCTSDIGDPQPKVTWNINGNPVQSKYLKELPSKTEEFEVNRQIKLRNSIVQMNIPLDKKMATDKQPTTKLEIQCVSTVPGINYTVSSIRTIKVTDENQLVKNQHLYWPNSSRYLSIDKVLFVFMSIVFYLI
ncbi:unnamed protein product [Brassicogethes aeneus]|uniref:Ig-like domain-containing protein n=1 Tax=Brassicogethes aeneus TaxID=1431903 RepID=A0A9P0FF59_BRAAE|nr:unnamed protein product [Brassicogethes aeneus]